MPHECTILLSFSASLGLDPAKPYFEGTNPRCRLDKNDAQFVDVIHTDIYQAGTHEEVMSNFWIVSFFFFFQVQISVLQRQWPLIKILVL